MNILKSRQPAWGGSGLIQGRLCVGRAVRPGVVTCRTGHGWSAPVFIRMAGGSFGLQDWRAMTDLVLVAVNDRGFQDLLKKQVQDRRRTRRPRPARWDANTQAATDWKMNAELLTYSRSKGLFAGIDLDGTSVSQNKDERRSNFGAPHPF